MSSTAYFPLSLTLEKYTFRPKRGNHSQYMLSMRFSEQAPPFPLHAVHLPPAILAALEEGRVAGFVASTLEVNSIARRSLEEGPDYLVTCARLKDGSLLKEEPPVLRTAKRRLWGQVAIAASVAVVLLSLADGPLPAWAGALALLGAAHWLREVRRMPGTDFTSYSTVVPKTPS